MKPLTKIGLQYNTDKAYFHLFTEFYNDYFASFLGRPINILEIGISEGNSIRMLREFFPEATIFGIDIDEKSCRLTLGNNIKTFLCSQIDHTEIEKIFDGLKFDIIIDDGSHITSHQQLTLAFLFPHLNKDGIYVCGDLHTSYRENFCDTDITTLEMLKNFQTTNQIKTNVLNPQQIDYLNTHIKKVELFFRDKNALRCYNCKNDNISNAENCKSCNTLLSPEDKSVTSIIKKKVLLVDAFIFYNEVDMLMYRLKTLSDSVDKIILVESTRTFMGNEKELFYDLNQKKRYKKFRSKVTHIVVQDMIEHPDVAKGEVWGNEARQRNRIDEGISKLNLDDEDIIVISDVDEIPNLDKIKNLNINDIASLEMDVYYYNIECKNKTQKFFATKVCTYATYLKFDRSAQKIRTCQTKNVIQNGGWHLSYFGNIEFITNKIRNFSHQELNTENIIKKIEQNIRQNNDLFNRETDVFEFVSKDENENLPPNMSLINQFFPSV
jgi:beta-1,4-mannosyl-glycoprotein beta-1,4-N-acetylglucosaminyltransferase